jgi:hypothetical protein
MMGGECHLYVHTQTSIYLSSIFVTIESTELMESAD